MCVFICEQFDAITLVFPNEYISWRNLTTPERRHRNLLQLIKKQPVKRHKMYTFVQLHSQMYTFTYTHTYIHIDTVSLINRYTPTIFKFIFPLNQRHKDFIIFCGTS